jgi:hypothetical protein
MAQNWLVNFMDKHDNKMAVVQVNCYQAPRAVSIAMGMLKKRDPEKHDLVLNQSYSILVEEA